jgi:hypothetical protein
VPGEVSEVADLLSGEPGGAQGILLGGEDLLRGRRAISEERDKAGVDGPRGFRRELLAHDGADQCTVAVVGAAAAAGCLIERSDAADQRRHDRVPALEQETEARVLYRTGRLWDAGYDLLPAEKELGGRAHHLRVPHGIEGELGVHSLDTLDREGLRFDLLLDEIPNRTHRARQGEGYVHVAPLVVDAYVVDQTELHEVHPDLRVYHVPELVSHAVLGYHSLTSSGRLPAVR